ncbi:hypothetical protein [Kangiella sediminilitoris]|uniref:Swt1-like HEPN domain-containing protein n=1 Tax=Kangiella sediminilitoris TaxID=1144748 RepID=A0A1B3B9Q2_9GAMM|nr:hypothetical protein [Kangiella sediminilitoris]AOE49515.1 hypothetical protein KS2013_791 [Kangiella sediminilitoris]
MFCREVESKYYKKLFDLEVYLRFIVIWELKGRWGMQWKSALSPSLLEQIEQKKGSEKSLGYIDYQTHGLLSYCSFSELRDLILGPLWDDCFSKWGAKECITADFKRVIAVRNKLAHFRNITKKDLRNVHYFLEYLEDWSEEYGRLSKYETKFTLEEFCINPKYKDDFKTFVKELNLQTVNLKDIEFDMLASIKGTHFTLTIDLDERSYSNQNLIKLLSAGSRFLSFVSLSKLGNSTEIFISLKTPNKNLMSFIPAIIDILNDTSDLESSETIEKKFEKYISESFLLTDKSLPYQFKK